MSDSYDVIIIGAGVVGTPMAITFARQGRKVLLIERDWSEPDRIVGELMQPGGLRALKQLGLIQAVNNIGSIHVKGYYIAFKKHKITINYPYKDSIEYNPGPVESCVSKDNDKLISDETLSVADFEKDERFRGVAFHHGLFIQNMRQIAKDEPNVTCVEGTATELIKDNKHVIGVKIKSDKSVKTYNAPLTVACDGIYSKFRKELSPKNTSSIGSYFVGLTLKDAILPAPNHGHVILGDHAPVLIYQISPHDTRILCAYNSKTAPGALGDKLNNYLKDIVLPNLPKETQPSFEKALATKKLKIMPNQYLSAKRNEVPGLLVLGDSLNMRHPLTGGGMTVGLNDVVLIAKLLSPEQVPDLSNAGEVLEKLSEFHYTRKDLGSVINTLSIALYSLFAAESRYLKILQTGCFEYFQRGGECVNGPASLLSGLLPKPLVLFSHFFSVAFYGIYCNFCVRGFVGFPIAVYEAFATLICAILVFTPYLWTELVS